MENIVYSFEGKTIAQLRAQYQTLLSSAATEVCTETGKVWEIDRQNDHSEQFISQFAAYLFGECQAKKDPIISFLLKNDAKLTGGGGRLRFFISENLQAECIVCPNFDYKICFADNYGGCLDTETEWIENSSSEAEFIQATSLFFHQFLQYNH
jgi:hypothetical protein